MLHVGPITLNAFLIRQHLHAYLDNFVVRLIGKHWLTTTTCKLIIMQMSVSYLISYTGHWTDVVPEYDTIMTDTLQSRPRCIITIEFRISIIGWRGALGIVYYARSVPRFGLWYFNYGVRLSLLLFSSRKNGIPILLDDRLKLQSEHTILITVWIVSFLAV